MRMLGNTAKLHAASFIHSFISDMHH